MLNRTTDKMNYLDTFFTQKDFTFLNSLEEEIKLIESQITKQEQKREFIVEVINYFENELKGINKSNINPISDMLEEIEKNFVLVNYNIKALYNLKDALANINTTIVNLLVNIESHPDNKQFYKSDADNLSKAIAEYTEYCAKVKTTISNNDLTLNQFLSSSSFKNIFDSINKNENISFKSPEEVLKNSNIENTQERANNIYSHYVADSTNSNLSKEYSNNILRVSEKENKVYLPYSNSEILSYLDQFPNDYKSAKEVIKKEFILSLDYYMKHPVLARFRETYSLIRDKESKSIMEAIKYSMNIMFTYELNPVIIAACKTQEQLENYLNCLQNNTLDKFTDFEIKFEVSLSKK